MNKYSLLILTLTLMLPAAANAQSLDSMIERGEQAGLDRSLLENVRERSVAAGIAEADVARLLQPAVALAEDGLPAKRVVQRALEGLAKQVPPDRVVAVLERLQHATEQAAQLGDPWLQQSAVREMLGPPAAGSGVQVRTMVLEGLAQALVHDVPGEALQATLERLPDHVLPGETSPSAVAAAFQILPDLPLVGQDPDLTAGLVAEALGAGFGASDMRRLPDALRAAQEQGDVPAAAVARGAISQMVTGTPAATVLESLFQGQIPGSPPAGMPPGLDGRPNDGRGGPPNHVPGGGPPDSV